MAITFSAKYLEEAAKILNTPDVIVQIDLDSGSIKIGEQVPFVGVITALEKPTSFQNKIDPAKGYATLGKFSFQIIGRENFKDLIKDEYLKNRRVTKYEGFMADGFTFSDYANTYTGIISNWTRKGDVLTVTVADDMQPTTKKFPVEVEAKTQYHDFSNMNPAEIKLYFLRDAAFIGSMIRNGDFEQWTGSSLDGWGIAINGTIAKETVNIKSGLTSLSLTWTSGGAPYIGGGFQTYLADVEAYQGKTITFGCYVKSSSPTPHIRIEDSDGYTSSATHSGGGDFEFLTVTRTLGASITYIVMRLYGSTAAVTYFDLAIAKEGSSISPLDGAVNEDAFLSERDLWLAGWKFQRVLVEPENIKQYLNELQEESNSFIVHDGERISYKVFSPAVPGQTVVELRDQYEILDGSVSQDSGYLDRFYNRIVIYYDYDESGDDKEENFDSIHFISDSDSEGTSQWDETTTKIIKSKWIKSHTFDQPATLPVIFYHVSKSNGLSAGKTGHEIKWNATNKTLSWTAPDGTEGDTVIIEEAGRFDLYDADTRKFVRIIVTDFATLDALGNTTDTITITALSGSNYAVAIANKWSNRYRDPVSVIGLKVGLNHTSNNGNMWKPTDSFNLTTDDACVFGKDTLDAESMMVLSVRPDGGSNEIALSAIQTKIFKRYGFIGASSITSDYPSATEAEREYAFIGDSNNKVNGGTEDGYYIW